MNPRKGNWSISITYDNLKLRYFHYLVNINNFNFLCSKSKVDLSESVDKLSAGLLSVYQKPFEHVKNELSDLT